MISRAAANAAISNLDKRTKIMIGALVLILVGTASFFLLKPGSSASSTAAIPATAPHVVPSATPTPTAIPAPAGLPVQANPGRDPFAPLAVEAASTATSSTAAVAAVTSTTTTTGATTTSPITATAATSHTITLVSIKTPSATLTVDGTDKTVKAGDTLATGVLCKTVTADAVFVTYSSKAYAIAPGQTVSF